jgi:hypothetical protein
MDRIIAEPILCKNNLNVVCDIGYSEWDEFIAQSYGMVVRSPQLMGRPLDGFDTREHSILVSYIADSMGVKCGYMDFGFKNKYNGMGIYGGGINVFQMDGWLAYYSPHLRCFIPEPKDGDIIGDIKLRVNEVVWNQHYYDIDIKPVTFDIVEAFMLSDETYKLQHSHLHKIDREFLCFNFGAELKRKANLSGIRCAVVLIADRDGNGTPGTHVLNAFETDRGTIYIEPQLKSLFIEEPTIGKSVKILQFEAEERADPTYIRNESGWDDARKERIERMFYLW